MEHLTDTDLATVCAEAFEYVGGCTAFDPHTGRATNAATGELIGTYPPVHTPDGTTFTLPITARPGATISLFFPIA